jgi:hypothetical protein
VTADILQASRSKGDPQAIFVVTPNRLHLARKTLMARYAARKRSRMKRCGNFD